MLSKGFRMFLWDNMSWGRGQRYNEVTMNNTMQKSIDYKVFSRIVQSEPKVIIDEFRDDGDVVFSVQMTELGIKPEAMIGNVVADTDFFNNFVGEYVVRKNVDQFAELLFGIDPRLYESVVCANDHTDFGMVVVKDMVRFSMHISLVQRILTEDFKKVIDG